MIPSLRHRDPTLEFRHRLPSGVALVEDRDAFLVERARGKVVLHLGCVDAGLTEDASREGRLLHTRLVSAARRVYGVDIDGDGVRFLQARGFDDVEERSAYEIDRREWPELELVIAGEILEHLDSYERFFRALRTVLRRTGAECLLSVPNAFSLRNLLSVAMWGTEIVHPDHNCYFSYRTLVSLVEKAGLHVDDVWAYSNVGRQTWAKRVPKRLLNWTLLRLRPYLAEGLVAQVSLPPGNPFGEGVGSGVLPTPPSHR